MFFNGEPLTLARWPNSGFVNGGTIIEPGSKKEGKPSVFEYLDDRHARWTKAEDAWLFGYFAHGWADRTLKIRSIDPATKRVTCGPYELLARSMEPVKWFNKGRIKYHVFNLLEELDQPGEWYLNRQTGILYFYPPSDPARATVEIGMLTAPMLSMANVAHVRIEGLVFDLSRSSGMLIRDSEHCLIAGCTLKRFAGNGITMTGGHENGIFGCDLYSLGRRHRGHRRRPQDAHARETFRGELLDAFVRQARPHLRAGRATRRLRQSRRAQSHGRLPVQRRPL